jgi:hypothetical protein
LLDDSGEEDAGDISEYIDDAFGNPFISSSQLDSESDAEDEIVPESAAASCNNSTYTHVPLTALGENSHRHIYIWVRPTISIAPCMQGPAAHYRTRNSSSGSFRE